MPLRRAPGIARPEQKSMGFPMQDVRSGGIVICRITEEALRRLSASPVHCMQTMFEKHRRAAETLASAKFDAGQRRPVVTLGDVSGTKPDIGVLISPNSHRGGDRRLSSSTKHPRAVASQPSAVRAT